PSHDAVINDNSDEPGRESDGEIQSTVSNNFSAFHSAGEREKRETHSAERPEAIRQRNVSEDPPQRHEKRNGPIKRAHLQERFTHLVLRVMAKMRKIH